MRCRPATAKMLREEGWQHPGGGVQICKSCQRICQLAGGVLQYLARRLEKDAKSPDGSHWLQLRALRAEEKPKHRLSAKIPWKTCETMDRMFGEGASALEVARVTGVDYHSAWRRMKWHSPARTGKLTAKQREEIKALRGQKTQREIGRMFGVSDRTVSDIQLGKQKA